MLGIPVQACPDNLGNNVDSAAGCRGGGDKHLGPHSGPQEDLWPSDNILERARGCSRHGMLRSAAGPASWASQRPQVASGPAYQLLTRQSRSSFKYDWYWMMHVMGW